MKRGKEGRLAWNRERERERERESLTVRPSVQRQTDRRQLTDDNRASVIDRVVRLHCPSARRHVLSCPVQSPPQPARLIINSLHTAPTCVICIPLPGQPSPPRVRPSASPTDPAPAAIQTTPSVLRLINPGPISNVRNPAVGLETQTVGTFTSHQLN